MAKKQKPDSKAMEVKIPIYPGYLYVCYTDDFLKHGRSIGIEYALNIKDCLGITSRSKHKKHTQRIIILLKHSEFEDYDTISHEALHAVNYIFLNTGTESTNNNDEHAAYLLGWIVGQIQKYNMKLKTKSDDRTNK